MEEEEDRYSLQPVLQLVLAVGGRWPPTPQAGRGGRQQTSQGLQTRIKTQRSRQHVKRKGDSGPCHQGGCVRVQGGDRDSLLGQQQ